MIGEERPGVDAEAGCPDEGGQARDEIGPVGVIPEDRAPLQPPDHHVLEDSRRIEARLARPDGWHGSTGSVRRQRPL